MRTTRTHSDGKEQTDLRSVHSAQGSVSPPFAGSAEPPHPALIALVRLLARQAAEVDLAAERAAHLPED